MSLHRTATLCALCCVALLSPPVVEASTRFIAEIADPGPNNVGWKPSLGLDAGGGAHIAYFDNTLNNVRFARRTASGWTLETIDAWASPTAGLSLALDPDGGPHVAYVDYDTPTLRYARRAHDSWIVQIADVGPGRIGYFPSLALDERGDPHISGLDAQNSALRYAQRFYGVWVRSWAERSNDSVWRTSLALEPGLITHICYRGAGMLKHARRSGGVWTREIADPIDSDYPAMVLDANGNIHVAYYDVDAQNLRYARKAAGQWTATTVLMSAENDGSYPSLALDANGDVHVSYFNTTSGELMYARLASGVWTIETLADAADGTSGYSSIALDGRGMPHVAYKGPDDVLMYTRAVQVVPPSGEGDAKASLAAGAEIDLHAFPNPSSDGIHVRYRSSVRARPRLTVLDVSGREVARFDLSVAPGEDFVWDGTTSTGERVVQGVYFLRLDAGSERAVRRVTFLR